MNQKKFISRLKLPAPEPIKKATPAKTGDKETWILVEREPLQDRLAQIALLCRRAMEGGAQSTTFYGLARNVLTIADAEIEARDRIKNACRHVFITKNGVDVCVLCKTERASC